MTTIAQMIDNAMKHGTPRSKEYRRGIEDVLKLKLGGQPIRCPFAPGTAQFDAYFAGNDRGHAIYRVEAERQAEEAEAVRSRVFFADADAL
jgi:hypothetical protein